MKSNQKNIVKAIDLYYPNILKKINFDFTHSWNNIVQEYCLIMPSIDKK